MPSRVRLSVIGLLAALSMQAPSVRAQEQWSWPEKPKNLQVLPKDFGAQRLQSVMKGFTHALGVRCLYCHVGQEGKPLGTFDFASDQNPNKERAREMYRAFDAGVDLVEKLVADEAIDCDFKRSGKLKLVMTVTPDR